MQIFKDLGLFGMKIDDKLLLLRKSMKQHDVDAYIMPSSDPHQSEYVADRWLSRAWISGFTGSAGIAVVTQNHAGIWTDSRYFLSAAKQLKDSEFVLHKVIKQFTPLHVSFLKERLPAGSTVGIDGWCFSKKQVDYLANQLGFKDIKLKTSEDLIEKIWDDRPAIPQDDIFIHDIKYAGKDRKDKISDIRKVMAEKKVDYHIITTLDDIAWIYNIRGNDVKCNPVGIAYTIISDKESTLYIDQEKVPDNVRNALEKDGVTISSYQSIIKDLNELDESTSILVDPSSCNVVLHKAINSKEIISGNTISRAMKAVKNETEIAHFKKVMVKDGVALAKMYRWLESELNSTSVSEYDLAIKLAKFRSEQEGYKGESFDAIVGYRANGAIVHYKPEADTCADINNNGVLLLDSGGQYLDGTTDITRTVSFSEPTAEEKKNNTLVLKGHIGLATAKFPVGTVGVQLDLLARQHLWQHGLNYLHGTGHGVGFFLNVHEDPQGFSPGISARSKCPIEVGMVTSNEPGYYKEGHYGIRIENLVVTVKSKDEGFLEFDTITLFPIDQRLMDKGLLNPQEKEWLDNYHQKVYNKLSPQLNGEEQEWLKEKCKPIDQ